MSRRTRAPATRPGRAGALIVAAVLVVAACGGVETSPTTVTPPPNTTTALGSGTGTTAPAGSVEAVLAGTRWDVTRYDPGTGTMVNLRPGTAITMRFGDDGSVSGSGGCNAYQGNVEVKGLYDEPVKGVRDASDGQAIRIGPFITTKMACASPTGIMEQETEYLDDLQRAGRWFIAQGNLILHTDDGSSLIEAEPSG